MVKDHRTKYESTNIQSVMDGNIDAFIRAYLLSKLENQDTNSALITNLGIEKEINTFFRLQNPTIHVELRKAFPDLPEELNNKIVFLKLRELRNIW